MSKDPSTCRRTMMFELVRIVDAFLISGESSVGGVHNANLTEVEDSHGKGIVLLIHS